MAKIIGRQRRAHACFPLLAVLAWIYVFGSMSALDRMSASEPRKGPGSLGASVPFHNSSENGSSYSTENITKAANMLTLAPGRLLIYDPAKNGFRSYTIAPTSEARTMQQADSGNACKTVLPILVDALLTARPERFAPDQPPFQLLFFDAEFT